MPRRQYQKKLSSRSYQKSVFANALILFFLTTLTVNAREFWPCPEFGPCKFQMIVGACDAQIHFEFSQRPQVVGRRAFWNVDEPRPCAINIRVGSNVQRDTLVRYRCEEVVTLFEKMVKQPMASKSADTDVSYCDRSIHRSLAILIYPDKTFKNGEWKTLNREVYHLNFLDRCHANFDEKKITCVDLDEEQKDFFTELLSKMSWHLRVETQEKKSQNQPWRLAPGDFMRSVNSKTDR